MVKLRIASAADAAAVNGVFDHYIRHSLATFGECCKTVAERAAEMETLLHDYPFLIAEDENGAFLGFANAEPIRAQSGYRYCAELTIYLNPDAPKGSGIGSALYTALLNMLTQQGFRAAVGVLFSENEASIALHKRFGFHEAARFSNCAYKHGRWLDALLYVKELNDYAGAPPAIIPFCEYQKRLVAQPCLK